jgi:hypothetical protein
MTDPQIIHDDAAFAPEPFRRPPLWQDVLFIVCGIFAMWLLIVAHGAVA